MILNSTVQFTYHVAVWGKGSVFTVSFLQAWYHFFGPINILILSKGVMKWGRDIQWRTGRKKKLKQRGPSMKYLKKSAPIIKILTFFGHANVTHPWDIYFFISNSAKTFAYKLPYWRNVQLFINLDSSPTASKYSSYGYFIIIIIFSEGIK